MTSDGLLELERANLHFQMQLRAFEKDLRFAAELWLRVLGAVADAHKLWRLHFHRVFKPGHFVTGSVLIVVR